MATCWFILLAAIFTAYAVLDGFDLGVGAIYRLVAKTDEERRVCLSSIGPLWNGNEVWLVAGGGSLFFSFPRVYAVGFSGFYLALMLVLWLLIVRGIALEFRNQLAHPLWIEFWDTGFMAGSALLTLLLGVALGNVVRGLPLDGRGLFQGSFGLMLGGYPVLIGLLSTALLSLHGANYLCLKSEGPLHDRARDLARTLAIAVVVLALLATGWSAAVRPHLMDNFFHAPLTLIFPLAVMAGLAAIVLFTRQNRDREAFAASTGLIISMLGATAASVYPDLLHSTVDPQFSLDVANASSSNSTLQNGLILIGSALVVVAFCQVFVYRNFLGKTHPDEYGGH